jgi:hypothetical protein
VVGVVSPRFGASGAHHLVHVSSKQQAMARQDDRLFLVKFSFKHAGNIIYASFKGSTSIRHYFAFQ